MKTERYVPAGVTTLPFKVPVHVFRVSVWTTISGMEHAGEVWFPWRDCPTIVEANRAVAAWQDSTGQLVPSPLVEFVETEVDA